MVGFKLGNGRSIRFWEDVWRGELAFATRFPSLYRISSLHNGKILDLWVNQTTDVAHSGGWNFHFVRAINEREMDELSELLDYLATTTICSSLEDRRVWLADKILITHSYTVVMC
ncbi:hypothetical protein TorRG33x02_275150 [Trema orientale]|uniref:Reverse transcriptase zinc-binding domain-containing protein n=1 Tax=Trema orientale TaxID=63057 RepID=A0A2P5CRY1_TREOI|nr:hypothetical protein TorRG33x02_275150 [Trema orientale]